MLDSSSSSSTSSVPQFGATPAPKAAVASSRSHGAHAQGGAHGSAAIEIFTSFHALVDAIAGDKTSASRSSDGEDRVAGAPTGEGKDEQTPASVVMPLDLAALMLPHTLAARGFGGHGQPLGAAVEGSGGEGDAGDLAALLVGVRTAGFINADAMAGTDADGADASISAAARQGLPIGASMDARADANADGDALAQAVIQRLLAAAAASSKTIAADIAGSPGTKTPQFVDDLIRQVVAATDHSSSGVNAARLITPHAGELAIGPAVSAFAAEVTGATGALLEPPSTAQLDQIVQSIRLQWSNGAGEAHIRLDPQHFGDVKVSMRVDQGQVVARLQADTPIVREWLQANQHLLRQSLGEHNLTLSRLEVSEPSESRHGAPRDGRDQQAEREERQPRRPRTPETGETFELIA